MTGLESEPCRQVQPALSAPSLWPSAPMVIESSSRLWRPAWAIVMNLVAVLVAMVGGAGVVSMLASQGTAAAVVVLAVPVLAVLAVAISSVGLFLAFGGRYLFSVAVISSGGLALACLAMAIR